MLSYLSMPNSCRAIAPLLQSTMCLKKTIHCRRAGVSSRCDCQPNSRKLTQLEEEVIVKDILDLDQREFAPTYSAVRDIADKLLTARGGSQVRQKWPANFVKRTDSLKTRFNRA
jgi:hypothetical protein